MTGRGETSPPPAGSDGVRRSLLLFAAPALVLLALGLHLRLARWPFHANVWGIDWLNYYEIQARHLHAWELLGFFASWEGLHPPVSGIIHGLGMVLGVGFPVHWAATTAASLAGPAIVAGWLRPRAGAGAALLILAWLMLSPQQANYALNTSPYPWHLLFGAASDHAMASAKMAASAVMRSCVASIGCAVSGGLARAAASCGVRNRFSACRSSGAALLVSLALPCSSLLRPTSGLHGLLGGAISSPHSSLSGKSSWAMSSSTSTSFSASLAGCCWGGSASSGVSVGVSIGVPSAAM